MAPDSTVETFVAVRLAIDPGAGRACPLHQGRKCLPVTMHGGLRPTCASRPRCSTASNSKRNYVRFRISPDITIAIGANVIAPGGETHSQTAEMVGTRLPRADEMDAYERVLGDAMHGDTTLFAREDYVEEAWRIVDPRADSRHAGPRIRAGHLGTEGGRLGNLAPGGWHNPTVKSS